MSEKPEDAGVKQGDTAIACCEHIFRYYDSLWQAHHQLGTNLLRRSYYQASRGIWFAENNLFGEQT